MPEFDQAQLAEYGKLAIRLAQNAKTRRLFTKLVKTVEPDRVFPDQDAIDTREYVEARLAKDKQEREHRETIASLERQKRSLIDSGEYTPDDVKEIEKVMTKFGIADYEAGAKLYAADHRPARPHNSLPSKPDGVWELPKLEGLLDDPVKAARKQAYLEIDRITAGRR